MGVLLYISFVGIGETYLCSRRNRRAIVDRDHFAAKSGTYLLASLSVGMDDGLT
jgi:hypothetical protein